MAGMKETDLVVSKVGYWVVLWAEMKETMMVLRLVGLKVEPKAQM